MELHLPFARLTAVLACMMNTGMAYELTDPVVWEATGGSTEWTIPATPEDILFQNKSGVTQNVVINVDDNYHRTVHAMKVQGDYTFDGYAPYIYLTIQKYLESPP